MSSHNYSRVPFSPPMYPDPNQNNRPIPPTRSEFQRSPQVPPRIDRPEQNNSTISRQHVHSCNYNLYATKKTIGHGLLDLALFMSNAMQLRTLIVQKQHDSIWIASLILVCISMIIHVPLVYTLIIVGKGNVQNPQKQRKLEKYNNIALLIILFISMINIVINVLMSITNPNTYLDASSMNLLRNNST